MLAIKSNSLKTNLDIREIIKATQKCCLFNFSAFNSGDTENPVNEILKDLTSDNIMITNLLKIYNFDHYTFLHSINVALLSIAIALSIGIPNREVRDIGAGALLHDIGKTMIPINILNKKGKVNHKELNELRKHVECGHEIVLTQNNYNETVKLIVWQHHERVDGSGYPLGISGSKITIATRIVSVADIFDALTSDRPYRKAFSISKALRILNLEAAKYDEKVVQIINNINSFHR